MSSCFFITKRFLRSQGYIIILSTVNTGSVCLFGTLPPNYMIYLRAMFGNVTLHLTNYRAFWQIGHDNIDRLTTPETVDYEDDLERAFSATPTIESASSRLSAPLLKSAKWGIRLATRTFRKRLERSITRRPWFAVIVQCVLLDTKLGTEKSLVKESVLQNDA